MERPFPITDPWEWYIYLHLVDFYGFHVGKYTSPMDGMGFVTGSHQHDPGWRFTTHHMLTNIHHLRFLPVLTSYSQSSTRRFETSVLLGPQNDICEERLPGKGCQMTMMLRVHDEIFGG